MHSTIPRGYVPLPDIGEYTSRVRVDSLGLPEGFDPESLGVNLHGLEKLARLIAARSLRIASHTQSEQFGLSGGIHHDGSLAATAGLHAARKPTSVANQTGESISVVLDTGAIEQKHPEVTRDVRSPKIRASVLNQAIRPGLRSAAYKSLGIDSLFSCGISAGFLSAGTIIAGLDNGSASPEEIVMIAGLNPFFWLLYGDKSKNTMGLLPLWPIDRHALACGQIATTRFFAPIPQYRLLKSVSPQRDVNR